MGTQEVSDTPTPRSDEFFRLENWVARNRTDCWKFCRDLERRLAAAEALLREAENTIEAAQVGTYPACPICDGEIAHVAGCIVVKIRAFFAPVAFQSISAPTEPQPERKCETCRWEFKCQRIGRELSDCESTPLWEPKR